MIFAHWTTQYCSKVCHTCGTTAAWQALCYPPSCIVIWCLAVTCGSGYVLAVAKVLHTVPLTELYWCGLRLYGTHNGVAFSCLLVLWLCRWSFVPACKALLAWLSNIHGMHSKCFKHWLVRRFPDIWSAVILQMLTVSGVHTFISSTEVHQGCTRSTCFTCDRTELEMAHSFPQKCMPGAGWCSFECLLCWF